MSERDAALRDLAHLSAGNRSLSARAREMRRLTVRYGAPAWHHDRDREAMPVTYRNTARQRMWKAFKSGAPISLGERGLCNILGD